MSQPPELFDRNAVLMRRARAAKIGGGMFLHEFAAAEITERLIEVNRTFTKVAIVGSFPEPWLKIFPNAVFIRDDDTLDIALGAFDLVIHALSLHHVNDPIGQLVQSRRALKDDGLLIAVMFGGKTLHELRASLSEAEIEISGGLSPRVTPMGELRELGALLQRSGFALPVADNIDLDVSYDSAPDLMRDLRAMGEVNSLASRQKAMSKPALFERMSEIYVQNFTRPDGRINASFEFIFLTGWAPSETQQKPLRPGSAKARLADALGVPEVIPD